MELSCGIVGNEYDNSCSISEKYRGRQNSVFVFLHTDGSSPLEVLRRYDIETLSERLHMAVVLPTGHRSYFCNLEYGAAYNDYLTQELLQKVRITFGCISERRENTFICGMGTGEKRAYEALKKHPELFAGGKNGTHTNG